MSNVGFVDDSHFTALLDVFKQLCCLQEQCPSMDRRPPPDFPNFSKRCIFASSHATNAHGAKFRKPRKCTGGGS
jgi:hypothetical protein